LHTLDLTLSEPYVRRRNRNVSQLVQRVSSGKIIQSVPVGWPVKLLLALAKEQNILLTKSSILVCATYTEISRIFL
jgi:hypothetical protein